MRQRIINEIRNNKIFFFLYKRIGSIIISLFGFFIPIKKNRILFVSFGGKKYDDSPKEIYLKMCNDKIFSDYQFIWAFTHPEDFMIEKGHTVKIDTMLYFYYALSSRIWITNVSIERGMKFKKKKTICVNTWHGAPIKKLSRTKKGFFTENFNIMCAQSNYDYKIFRNIFNVPEDKLLLCDLPRNDILLRYTSEDILKIKKQLCIPKDKKVILYMPTYREFLRDKENYYYFAPPIDLLKWESLLSEKYILLIRGHHLILKNMEFKENQFVRNVTAYPQLSELFAISDIMVSDYSSAFFDFSILDRPMLCYAYDYDEYKTKRGFYIDIEKELPCPIDKKEDDVINRIRNMDDAKASIDVNKFHKKYAPYAGNATEQVIQELLKMIT